MVGGGLPEWVNDFSDLAGYANLLSVVPTFIAVLLVPHHFFRRVGAQGKRPIPLAVAPTKLIVQTAVLAGLCLLPLGYRAGGRLLLLAVIAIAFSSPIWVALLVGLTAFFAKAFREGGGRGPLLAFLFLVLLELAPLLPLETMTCRCSWLRHY